MRTNKQHVSLKQEQGRSMVEMLGVLAIIGVLSIGGITGYTIAMNRHRTNEILNGAMQRAYLVAAQIASGRTPSLTEFEEETVGGTFDSNVITLPNEFAIKVSEVNATVCKNMLRLVSESNVIKSITKEYDIDNPLLESDCDGGNNNFFIVINNDLSPS